MNNTKPITSHECGNGKYARRVWGSVEDCRLCTERKERMEKARAMYAKKDVIAYTDGTHGAIDADGILRDVGPVNVLIANEREYRAEAESAFTQAVGYAALGTFGFLFALLLIP